MKLIAGLGNPGPEYAGTRHNAGWWAVEAVRRAWGLPAFRDFDWVAICEGERAGEPVALVKPLTYMNRSGMGLPLPLMEGFDIARDLLVLVDDVNLAVGRVRLRPSGSAGGHNGLRSVEGALGTRDYARLRIGVGAKPPGENLAEWVLSPMPPEEEEVVIGLLPHVVGCVETWLERGAVAAMQCCNR